MKHITGIIVFISLFLCIIGQAIPDKVTMNSLFHTVGKPDKQNSKIQDIGLKVIDLTQNEKALRHLMGGVKVIEIHKGKSRHITQMRVGFIILKVNNISISSSDQFSEILSRQNECSVILEGVYPDSPITYYYAFEIE